MESKLSLNWCIYNNEINHEIKYCHNCGKKVEFEDSLKRRQNANGKNIFYFAIYKCSSGHTWNKQIAEFKAVSGLENIDFENKYIKSEYEELSITMLKEKGINEVEISLDELNDKIRLDKFLSSKIIDISRVEIVKLINKGFIKINCNLVKSNVSLKKKDIITLILDSIRK
ncbi:S4 domain-containing protein [Clostridium akagii]|uniref:S4 domain-containing protein n=1 Tax=Clostridium akagii TaxID=91623 RepID=UPI00047E96A6|nr:S4 domain-containing protein [Clostridium akagii]